MKKQTLSWGEQQTDLNELDLLSVHVQMLIMGFVNNKCYNFSISSLIYHIYPF